MTKKELVNSLAQWPDNAIVEIAIAKNLSAKEPFMEDKFWLDVEMIEDINPAPNSFNEHCLIFGGKITAE